MANATPSRPSWTRRRWSLAAGYRAVEGGADVEEVYNFAWFNYGLVSVVFRF